MGKIQSKSELRVAVWSDMLDYFNERKGRNHISLNSDEAAVIAELHTAAQKALYALTADAPWDDNHYHDCRWCGNGHWYGHEPDCPVRIAAGMLKAALGVE